MLSTSQYHLFFNSNIHKILTVCKKTWVMAHQRTVTKNRYIFSIINQGKKIHILYAYTGDQNTKDGSQEGKAQSQMSDVHQGGASALPTWPDMNGTGFASWHKASTSSHVFYFKTVCSVDLINPKTSINTIYATVRQTHKPTHQTDCQPNQYSRPTMCECKPNHLWNDGKTIMMKKKHICQTSSGQLLCERVLIWYTYFWVTWVFCSGNSDSLQLQPANTSPRTAFAFKVTFPMSVILNNVPSTTGQLVLCFCLCVGDATMLKYLFSLNECR